MKMGLFYTRKLGDPVSDSIALITGGYWSHCGVRFLLDESEPESEVYYESVWKVDKDTGKDGLRGPIPMANLIEWAEEDPHNKLYCQPWLPIELDKCLLAMGTLNEVVPQIRYAKLQLLKNARYALTKRWTINGTASKEHWHCAEVIGRTLLVAAPEIAIDRLDIGNVVVDMLTPSGLRGIGICEQMEGITNQRT